MKKETTGKTSKHVRSLTNYKVSNLSGGCRQCHASCQSACKTSCTVGNLACERK